MSCRAIECEFKGLTHLLMVRMARSPRLIWGTPWSQPVQVSKPVLNAQLGPELDAGRLNDSSLSLTRQRTLNQTANTDGSSEGGAPVPGAIEPIHCRVISTNNPGDSHNLGENSLVAHVMVVSLAGVIETARVVNGDIVPLLGEVDAVAGGQSLLLDAHCECEVVVELMEMLRQGEVLLRGE